MAETPQPTEAMRSNLWEKAGKSVQKVTGFMVNPKKANAKGDISTSELYSEPIPSKVKIEPRPDPSEKDKWKIYVEKKGVVRAEDLILKFLKGQYTVEELNRMEDSKDNKLTAVISKAIGLDITKLSDSEKAQLEKVNKQYKEAVKPVERRAYFNGVSQLIKSETGFSLDKEDDDCVTEEQLEKWYSLYDVAIGSSSIVRPPRIRNDFPPKGVTKYSDLSSDERTRVDDKYREDNSKLKPAHILALIAKGYIQPDNVADTIAEPKRKTEFTDKFYQCMPPELQTKLGGNRFKIPFGKEGVAKVRELDLPNIDNKTFKEKIGSFIKGAKENIVGFLGMIKEFIFNHKEFKEKMWAIKEKKFEKDEKEFNEKLLEGFKDQGDYRPQIKQADGSIVDDTGRDSASLTMDDIKLLSEKHKWTEKLKDGKDLGAHISLFAFLNQEIGTDVLKGHRKEIEKTLGIDYKQLWSFQKYRGDLMIKKEIDAAPKGWQKMSKIGKNANRQFYSFLTGRFLRSVMDEKGNFNMSGDSKKYKFWGSKKHLFNIVKGRAIELGDKTRGEAAASVGGLLVGSLVPGIDRLFRFGIGATTWLTGRGLNYLEQNYEQLAEVDSNFARTVARIGKFAAQRQWASNVRRVGGAFGGGLATEAILSNIPLLSGEMSPTEFAEMLREKTHEFAEHIGDGDGTLELSDLNPFANYDAPVQASGIPPISESVGDVTSSDSAGIWSENQHNQSGIWTENVARHQAAQEAAQQATEAAKEAAGELSVPADLHELAQNFLDLDIDIVPGQPLDSQVITALHNIGIENAWAHVDGFSSRGQLDTMTVFVREVLQAQGVNVNSPISLESIQLDSLVGDPELQAELNKYFAEILKSSSPQEYAQNAYFGLDKKGLLARVANWSAENNPK